MAWSGARNFELTSRVRKCLLIAVFYAIAIAFVAKMQVLEVAFGCGLGDQIPVTSFSEMEQKGACSLAFRPYRLTKFLLRVHTHAPCGGLALLRTTLTSSSPAYPSCQVVNPALTEKIG